MDLKSAVYNQEWIIMARVQYLLTFRVSSKELDIKKVRVAWAFRAYLNSNYFKGLTCNRSRGRPRIESTEPCRNDSLFFTVYLIGQ